MIRNLPDLAHATYPKQWRCDRCNVSLTEPSPGMWRDLAGSEFCFQGLNLHVPREVKAAAPVVTPSPLLRGGWRRWR